MSAAQWRRARDGPSVPLPALLLVATLAAGGWALAPTGTAQAPRMWLHDTVVAPSASIPLAANYTLLRLLPTGSDPAGPMLYDPQNARIYIPNLESSNISVVDAATGSPLPPIALPASALGLALDPVTREIYAPAGGTSGIAVIDATNDSVVANLTLGTQNGLPAYDPANGELYVGEEATGNVLVVNATAHTAVTTVSTGSGALDPVPDPSAGVVFVTNPAAGTVSVISDTSNQVTFQIPGLPGAEGAAVDPANGLLAVGHLGNGSIALVPITSPAAPGPVTTVAVDAADPEWPEFVPGLGGMFVPTGSDVGIVPERSATETAAFARGSGAASILFEPHGRDVYVTEPGYDEVAVYRVGPELYPVLVRQSGLSPGVEWSATLNGSILQSNGSTIAVVEPNGSYPFDVSALSEPNGSGYTPAPSQGTIRVDGSSATINVTFAFAHECDCSRTSGPGGLSGEEWLIVGIVAGAVVGGVAVSLVRFWRPKPPPPPPPEDETYH